jgi:hypothetical protein
MSKLYSLTEKVKNNMAQKSHKHPRISSGGLGLMERGRNLTIWSFYNKQASTKYVIYSKKSTLINIKYNINIITSGRLYEADTTLEAFSQTPIQEIHYFVEVLLWLLAHTYINGYIETFF